MGDVDVDFSSRGSEFEGVGEDVHHHLVEVSAVNPYGQRFGVVLVGKADLLGVGLMLEERVYFFDKRDEVGFLHVHLHHALVDFPEVHHLVDEVENSLSIALDGFVDAASMRVVVLFHEREQRRDDERHGRTDFVADVHEELQLGFAHLFGVNMLLQLQAVLLFSACLLEVLPNGERQEQQIEDVGHVGAIPRGVNHKRELTFGRLDVVALGFHSEVIGAWSQVRESDFVDTRLQANKLFAVDAIKIGDVLGVVVGER